MDSQAMITALNDHGFTDESTTAKVRALQESVWDIEGREPWPFIEKTATLAFNGSSSAPTNLPSDFRAATYLRLIGQSQKLRPVEPDELETLANGDLVGVGYSRAYYFEAGILRVWPVPSATDTAWLRYLRWSAAITDTSLETDFLIPKQFHRLIVYGALWKLYDMEDDPELATRFEQHYENGLGQMRAALWARQYDEPQHIRITDPDDYYGEF